MSIYDFSTSSFIQDLEPGILGLVMLFCLVICGIIIAINNCNIVDNIVTL